MTSSPLQFPSPFLPGSQVAVYLRRAWTLTLLGCQEASTTCLLGNPFWLVLVLLLFLLLACSLLTLVEEPLHKAMSIGQQPLSEGRDQVLAEAPKQAASQAAEASRVLDDTNIIANGQEIHSRPSYCVTQTCRTQSCPKDVVLGKSCSHSTLDLPHKGQDADDVLENANAGTLCLDGIQHRLPGVLVTALSLSYDSELDNS